MGKDQPLDYQTPQPGKRQVRAVMLAIGAAIFFALAVAGVLFFRVAPKPAATPTAGGTTATVTVTPSSYYAPSTTQPATRPE
jgi:hypothetical protein